MATSPFGGSNPAPSPPLILASTSPRRRELIALLGVPFVVEASRYEEPAPPDHAVDLDSLVCSLAREKAREVAARFPGRRVLGADTLVTLAESGHGVPLGKPTHEDDARRMLALLAGHTHVVHTGIVLVEPGGIELAQAERTRVRFRQLSPAMIDAYVATGEPMDKAGAYGAQGYAAPFIESFHGDYYNVVGLPVAALGRLLEASGWDWWAERALAGSPPGAG